MRICIDMRPALSRSTGVGVYLQNLVAALASQDSANEYFLFSSSWKERYIPPAYGPNFKICDRRWPVSLLNYAWHRWSFPPMESLAGADLDIVHSPGPLLIPSRAAHRVTTVHDLYFLTHPEHTAREIRRDYAALARKHCEHSDAIIAISEYTRQQLIDLLKIPASHIYTIRHGADPFFSHPVAAADAEATLARLGIARPFFLFAGAREPRKNLPALLDAFGKLSADARLVVAGPPGEPIRQEKVVETGYVSRQDLRDLYRSAVALVMPSLDEGFGLPLLEAMLSGAPIIASNIPAFQEVADQAFLPVDPHRVDEIRNAMEMILGNEPLRTQLAALGHERAGRFSWQEAARKTLELYQNL